MLPLYFDKEKVSVYLDGRWIDSPLGMAFIDFISIDFIGRHFEEALAINENPLLTLFNTIEDIRNLNSEMQLLIVEFQLATDYILSVDFDYFKEMDIPVRHAFYTDYVNNTFFNVDIKTSYILKQTAGNKVDINAINVRDMEDLNRQLPTLYKDCKYEIIEMYYPTTIKEALYITFMKMIANKVVVKKCKCCGKFFIPEGRIDTEYCNRIAPNSKKTCSEIGAIKKYHERSNNNPILKEFQKEYKKMNARVKLKKITQENFYKWSEKARELRDEVLNKYNESTNKDEVLDDFTNQLKNLEV